MKKAKFKNPYKKQIKISTIICSIFLIICFFCFFFLNQYGRKVSPKLIEIAGKNIEKLTFNIFNNYKTLATLDDDLISNILEINKNNKNEIINVNYNVKKAYKIMDIITSQIQADFQAIESGKKKVDYVDEELTELNDGLILTIPIGIASNNIYLANLGPRIPVKVKFTGTLLTNLKLEFKTMESIIP